MKGQVISLSVHSPGESRTDRKESHVVANSHLADKDLVKLNKFIYGKSAKLAAIKLVATEARNYLKDKCMSWQYRGSFLVSADSAVEVVEELNRYKAKWDNAVADFVSSYDDIVEKAKGKLGNLAPVMYPSKEEIAEKFSFIVNISPLSDLGDDSALTKDIKDSELREQMISTYKRSVRKCSHELLDRVGTVLDKFATSVGAYEVDENGKTVKRFRSEVVDGLSDIVGVVRKMNVFGDQDVLSICADVEKKFSLLTPELLRASEELREAAVSSAMKESEKIRKLTRIEL